MKILVVSGFLGAGKTTFIKALAKYTGKEFAVLENEYGASGIDGERLSNGMTNGEVNIWEMTEGCICCSAKGDFAASVLTIANALDPEYLVVEPTGVGMLGQIIENLKQIEYERISLLAPITVVDIHSWQRSVSEYRPLYENQVKEAKSIIVSKTEHSSLEEKQKMEEFLTSLNPEATVITDHYSELSETMWHQFLETNYDGTANVRTVEETEILPDAFSMSKVQMNTPAALFVFLECLIRGEFGDIVRAKGQVPVGDEVIQFDVVDGYYSITGSEISSEGKIVFIGSHIQRQKIRRNFLRKGRKKNFMELPDIRTKSAATKIP